MSKSKEPYHIPLTLADEKFAEKWCSIPYTGKEFQADEACFVTSFGLRVRSKSELIIAETLTREHIPFKYEYPVALTKYTVYPDFVCLNVRTRKTYVWEHFCRMDDAEYLEGRRDKLAALCRRCVLRDGMAFRGFGQKKSRLRAYS